MAACMIKGSMHHQTGKKGRGRYAGSTQKSVKDQIDYDVNCRICIWIYGNQREIAGGNCCRNHHNGVHVLFYQRDKMKQIWHCDEMSESHLKNKA